MLWSLLGLLFLQAEYRVYQLDILDNNGQKVREVVSTLDHLQYPEYFHVPQNQEVVYIDSWKCYGDTSNYKAYCPNPKQPAGRLPSSQTEN